MRRQDPPAGEGWYMRWRQLNYAFMSTGFFDNFILICILLNTLSMTLPYYAADKVT